MAWYLKALILTALSVNLVLGSFSEETFENFRHPINTAKQGSTPRTSLFRPNASPDFTRTVKVSPDINATWTVYYDISKIDFYVEAKTNGFVGFGITDDGRRTDLIIGGLIDGELPYFDDRYSASGNDSTVDAKQDWLLHDIAETEDSTLIWFIRSLNTSDETEDIVITDRNTSISWMLGETDDIEGPRSSGLFSVNILDPGLPTDNFERTETLDPNLFLTWSVNFNTKRVTFDLTGNTTGYIGFGIGKTGSMITDLVVGGVDMVNLTPYISDGTGSATKTFVVDPIQDYHLITASENNGTTHLRFIRDFNTGDPSDYVIKYENAYFLWALGTADIFAAHTATNRGAFAVNPLLASA